MREQRTAYELAGSQVVTPAAIVDLCWRVTHRYRRYFPRVLDLGAGDGRFAAGGRYDTYEGVEIDRTRRPAAGLPRGARIDHTCAFKHKGGGFSACVGNPPYVRHHDLDKDWRDGIAARLQRQTGQVINRKCNLYVYFMFLALLKTNDDGLVSVLVPYEWLSRPSAEPLRRFILLNNWHVDAYRFSEPPFGGVLTTASLSVIDKGNTDGEWCYHRLSLRGGVSRLGKVTGTTTDVLPYEHRGELWAMRGMSPGTQTVFTLTEGERIHGGLTHEDVMPCATSLRDLAPDILTLTPATFRRYFIEAGAKCWLIKSHKTEMSPRLRSYLASIPKERRDTWTCSSRKPWYRYPLFEAPGLLVSSGFTEFGPKIVVNKIQARAVGAVCGVYAQAGCDWARLRDFLKRVDFEKRVVPHAKQLKKVEVRQLNAVLNTYGRWESRHA